SCRSPASCAAWARSSLVIGSCSRKRLASAACFRAARESPAPTATRPRDTAASPFSRRRARAAKAISGGMRKTKRRTPQTIDQTIATAATAPNASISETLYSTPRQVRVTTPGLSASHVRPQAARATAASRINRRNITSPLSQRPARGPGRGEPTPSTVSGFGPLGQPRDRRLANRLKRRVRRLSRSRLGRPGRGRLSRRLGQLGEGGKRAGHVAAAAVGLDLRGQGQRIVAGGLAQVAHLNEAAQMGKKAV